MKKRIVSMCLALLMAASLLPLEVTDVWASSCRSAIVRFAEGNLNFKFPPVHYFA